MPVENVYTIPGRGTAATGRVTRGAIQVGEEVEVVGLLDREAKVRRAMVTGTQAFHRDIERAEAGQNVELLLREMKRDELVRGQVLARPGSVQPHANGRAELYALSSEEGGRKMSFGAGYRPQFFFGNTEVTGTLVDVGERGLVRPGDRATVCFELHRAVALEPGMRFAVREGGRTIGAGFVMDRGSCQALRIG